MWNLFTSVAQVAGGIDLSNDLSLLSTGLVITLWVSAGMIAFSAMQHFHSQSAVSESENSETEVEYRDAA